VVVTRAIARAIAGPRRGRTALPRPMRAICCWCQALLRRSSMFLWPRVFGVPGSFRRFHSGGAGADPARGVGREADDVDGTVVSARSCPAGCGIRP
jgi:hypothetical protein